MRYLLRLAPPPTDKQSFLATLKSVAKATGADARNPKWTSYGALELDIFVPSKADFETFIAAAEPLGTLEFVRDLNQAPKHMSEDEIFAEARSQFNAERYWECHETLEGVWRNRSGEEKILLQGLILVCAAFVHHQKGEDDVATRVLRRAAAQLLHTSGVRFGINIADLSRHVEEVLSGGSFQVFKV